MVDYSTLRARALSNNIGNKEDQNVCSQFTETSHCIHVMVNTEVNWFSLLHNHTRYARWRFEHQTSVSLYFLIKSRLAIFKRLGIFELARNSQI